MGQITNGNNENIEGASVYSEGYAMNLNMSPLSNTSPESQGMNLSLTKYTYNKDDVYYADQSIGFNNTTSTDKSITCALVFFYKDNIYIYNQFDGRWYIKYGLIPAQMPLSEVLSEDNKPFFIHFVRDDEDGGFVMTDTTCTIAGGNKLYFKDSKYDMPNQYISKGNSGHLASYYSYENDYILTVSTSTIKESIDGTQRWF